MSSHLEALLAQQLTLAGLGDFVTPFKAVEGRHFAWDFSWPEHRLPFENLKRGAGQPPFRRQDHIKIVRVIAEVRGLRSSPPSPRTTAAGMTQPCSGWTVP